MTEQPAPPPQAAPPRKILLLNLPRFTDGAPLAREECALGPSFALPIPNALMNIGAALGQSPAEVSLFDAAAENADFSRVASLLDSLKPDAVVSTILCNTISYEAGIARLCAARGILCAGVPMPAAYAEKTAAAGPFLFTVKSEPEKTILEWANGTPVEDLDGAIYIRGGETVCNPARKPWFDMLPPFNWSLLKGGLRSYGWKLYQLSRNCKWGCVFCQWAAGAPRFKNLDTVFEDLTYIKMNSTGTIGLLTASITQNREWFAGFAEKAPRLRIRFTTDIRADEVERKDILALRRAGCVRALLGVESMSQRLLDAVNKRETVERNMQAIRWCNEIGIATDATLIFNIGESDAEAEEYARLIMRCRPTRVIPVIYKKLEGTRPPVDTPLTEKLFWGTEPMQTLSGLENAERRVERFKKAVRGLKRRLALWYLVRPRLWPAAFEDLLSKIRGA